MRKCRLLIPGNKHAKMQTPKKLSIILWFSILDCYGAHIIITNLGSRKNFLFRMLCLERRRARFSSIFHIIDERDRKIHCPNVISLNSPFQDPLGLSCSCDLHLLFRFFSCLSNSEKRIDGWRIFILIFALFTVKVYSKDVEQCPNLMYI